MNDEPFERFLRSTDVVDAAHPAVAARAHALAAPHTTPLAIAKACFEWVRDDILHSRDHRRDPLTYRASDVLHHETGYCFAKAHLLVALLRANHIPAGFCYQRVPRDDNGPPYTRARQSPLDTCILNKVSVLSKLPTKGTAPMNRRDEKPLREVRPLSDAQVVGLELRTAVSCLRAAREQLELAAVSMAVVSSVDNDDESFADADALVEAATEVARTLERQIVRRMTAASSSVASSVSSQNAYGGSLAHAPGLARAQARNSGGVAGGHDGQAPQLAAAAGDSFVRLGRTVH